MTNGAAIAASEKHRDEYNSKTDLSRNLSRNSVSERRASLGARADPLLL